MYPIGYNKDLFKTFLSIIEVEQCLAQLYLNGGYCTRVKSFALHIYMTKFEFFLLGAESSDKSKVKLLGARRTHTRRGDGIFF